METITLYRPVGIAELALIEKTDWREFPPRLPEQPIFYPVLNEEYAIQIVRDWNAKFEGAGFITKFEVKADFISQYEIQIVGGSIYQELWILADYLPEFNRNIIGKIKVIKEFN